jgi:integrase
MLAPILALAIAAFIYQLFFARIFFDHDEQPAFPEYEQGLDLALLAGVSVRRDHETPEIEGLGAILPKQRKSFQQFHLPLALTPAEPGTYVPSPAIPAPQDDDPMRTQLLTQTSFGPAAASWLETRRPYLSAETIRNYSIYIKTLSAFFGEMKLQEIDADQVCMFQRARLTAVGPGEINKECSVLMQMRKRIGMPLGDYQPLKVSKESRGRPLSDQEEKAIEVAGKFSSELEPGHLFVLIAKNTGGCHKELRHLQLKNIDLDGRNIYFPRSTVKNDYRMREVPLNDDAFAAICRALEIAVGKGARDPEHYLFPGRRGRGGSWDPTRPQTSFKKAWAKICEQAGIKHLRIHDLRHHACSGMLSDPRVTRQAAKDVLGHVSDAMLDRYCHLKREAKRVAVEALQRKKPQPVKIPSWLLKRG